VSAPIAWPEVAIVDPAELTVLTMPARFTRLGDLHADLDRHPYAIEPLLDWAERDERAGAPAPPPLDEDGSAQEVEK
jgi:DNA primase